MATEFIPRQTRRSKESEMKRHIVTVSLLSTMIGAGATNSLASPPPVSSEKFANGPTADVPPPKEMAPPMMIKLQREKSLLNLTTDQEKKIADILARDREKISPLLEKADSYRKQLYQAEQAPLLDEPGLRSLAADLSKTETELIVSHAMMNRQVLAVLTPAQKELLQKQGPEPHFRPGPHQPGTETGRDAAHGR
jgi:Spy/CpxP family protein refolding chaperone